MTTMKLVWILILLRSKLTTQLTGAEVTDKFDITVNNGVITATLEDGFTKSLGDRKHTSHRHN